MKNWYKCRVEINKHKISGSFRLPFIIKANKPMNQSISSDETIFSFSKFKHEKRRQNNHNLRGVLIIRHLLHLMHIHIHDNLIINKSIKHNLILL